MERTKLYKLIIAALVIINTGMLIFFLSGKPPHERPKPGYLAEQLGIEGPKRKILMKLAKDHHGEKRKLMQNGRQLHEDLFAKIGTDEDVSSIQKEIEVNHAKVEKITYEFFNEVSKLCTPEQKEKLKVEINHVFRQMLGPPKR